MTQAKSPPPDLPSLLLDARIVYLGMPLVSAVTELIIAELLYLQVITKACQHPHGSLWHPSLRENMPHIAYQRPFLIGFCSIRTASNLSTCTSTAQAPLVQMVNR